MDLNVASLQVKQVFEQMGAGYRVDTQDDSIIFTCECTMSAYGGRSGFCVIAFAENGYTAIQFLLGKIMVNSYTLRCINDFNEQALMMKASVDDEGDLHIGFVSQFVHAEDAGTYVTFAFNSLFSDNTVKTISPILSYQPTSSVSNYSTSSSGSYGCTEPSNTVNTKEDVTVVDLILCLFLGGIGVHKFYRKKIGMGILYLFTFGLGGFGVLFDLIKIIVGLSKKENKA